MVRFKFRPDDSYWIRTLQDFKLVTNYKRVDQIILCHVFKIRSGTALDYLGEFFHLASSVHGHSTRFWDNGSYTIPKIMGFWKEILCL